MPGPLAKTAVVSTLVIALALGCGDRTPAPTDALDRIELATGVTAYANGRALIVRNDSTGVASVKKFSVSLREE